MLLPTFGWPPGRPSSPWSRRCPPQLLVPTPLCADNAASHASEARHFALLPSAAYLARRTVCKATTRIGGGLAVLPENLGDEELAWAALHASADEVASSCGDGCSRSSDSHSGGEPTTTLATSTAPAVRQARAFTFGCREVPPAKKWEARGAACSVPPGALRSDPTHPPEDAGTASPRCRWSAMAFHVSRL